MNPPSDNADFRTYRNYDHLLIGSPLRRGDVCVWVCAALIGVLVFATFIHFGVLANLRPGGVSVFFLALALSTLLSVVPTAGLWFLDRRERETPWLFLATFLWGGLIATAIALPFNTAFLDRVDVWVAARPVITEILGPDATSMLSAPISAPIVEEIAKALGVLLLFWLLRAEFDNMRDGIVYGAFVGVGFNWYEAALYVAQGYLQYGVAPYGLQLGGRYALFGFGGHALYSGIFGAFLGVSLQTRYRLLRVVAPLVGLALAVAAHMLNNALPLLGTLAGIPAAETGQPGDVEFFQSFLGETQYQITHFWPFILVMALALWRSGAWERRVIREELADEVGHTVTPDEYRDIVGDRMFRTRRIDAARPKESAALVNAQHELAFRKRRVKDEGKDPNDDALAAAWRDGIRHRRTSLE